MEEKRNTPDLLDLLTCPGFCVKENIITRCNTAAGSMVAPGTDILPLLATGREEYLAFAGGILYLTLSLSGSAVGASVVHWEDGLLFLLEDYPQQRELRTLSLAAQQMRLPLHNVMSAASVISQSNPEAADSVARLNRGLNQLLRMVGNMADAGHYHLAFPETRNITAVLDSAFRSASDLAEQAGYCIRYQGLTEEIYGTIDAQQLERAIFNILSNAMKYTPKTGRIEAEAVRMGATIRISIRDTGEGIPDDILGSIFHRYQRQPAAEDFRRGVGLGMVIVRTAAASHGGTVLVDRPPEGGTRVTFTLTIRQNTDNTLRSCRLLVDYAGEWDHSLVELSDALPAELYQKNL